MNIGTILRERRLQRGESLEDVAFRAGIDAGNLSRIERGKQDVSVHRLDRMCSALGMTLGELFSMLEGKPPRPHGAREVRETTRAFDQRTRDFLAVTRKLDARSIRLLTRIAKVVRNSERAAAPPHDYSRSYTTKE